MIFKNIEFHNVAEIQQCDKGYKMSRLPSSVRKQLQEAVKERVSYFSTGVELRFKIIEGDVTLTLRSEQGEEAYTAFILYGSFQGGWKYSSKTIFQQETRITIPAPGDLNVLQEITKERKLGFNPEVVRVILPYGICYFVDVEGNIEPPSKEDMPKKTYLAYGSSITHGSLSLAAPYTYPFRISQMMKCDYINLGFAGSALMEQVMAEYIISRKDWDFASLEIGINMIGDSYSVEEFEMRVRNFLSIMSRETRPVFLTSIFGFIGPAQEKAAKYREIVKKYANRQFIFSDGLELLNKPEYISQDLTHPSLEGVNEIANNWYNVMRNNIIL